MEVERPAPRDEFEVGWRDSDRRVQRRGRLFEAALLTKRRGKPWVGSGT